MSIRGWGVCENSLLEEILCAGCHLAPALLASHLLRFVGALPFQSQNLAGGRASDQIWEVTVAQTVSKVPNVFRECVESVIVRLALSIPTQRASKSWPWAF
eukprot:148374-Amphidinium_carterae.1